MWTNPLTIALVAAGSSLLTILVGAPLQNFFWKRQRRDELRLAAIGEFNRLTNAYVAACLFPGDPRPPESEWIRNINTAGATIRVLFSKETHDVVKSVDAKITGYSSWLGANRKALAHEFTDACYVALRAMYGEVVSIPKQP